MDNFKTTTEFENGLIHYLEGFVTPQRKLTMEGVITQRTRYITPIIENIFQPHNASAVLRTCDALGIQDVHIIEKNNSYKVNPEIALGAAQWLSLEKYKGEEGRKGCFQQLRSQGYRIVATTPHTRAQTIETIDLESGPMALVFGTELTGLSQEALDDADEYVYIPMKGFVESFNISVCAAIILQHLRYRLEKSSISWQLSETQRRSVWLSWLRTSIKSADALERRFTQEYSNHEETNFT